MEQSTDREYYLCVTPFFPSPTDWRGSYILDQVKAIKKHSNFKVVVFKSVSFFSKEESYEIEGIKVNVVPSLLMPSYLLNGLTEYVVGKLFGGSLAKYGIDISKVKYIHCHTANHAAFGFGIKRLNSDAKVIVQFHDLDPLTIRNGIWADKRWNRRYRAKKSMSALNRADLLVCISEPVKDCILSFPKPRKGEVYESALLMYEQIEDLGQIHPKNLYILNNGVDIQLFHPQKSSPKDSLYRIGCIANFQPLKDHITLLKAFKHLIDKGYSDMRLSLLGTGETKEEILQFVINNELTDYVEWPKEVTHDRLPDYYNTLSIFVLPSRFEGFGCVYTEAYACGVPFICCENQGAYECITVEDRDKWAIIDRDYKQLANLIERHYKERNRQSLCKEIDIDLLIKDYLKFIEKI